MKIKFNLDDDLHLKKTLELRYMVKAVRSVLYETTNTIGKLSWINVFINYKC